MTQALKSGAHGTQAGSLAANARRSHSVRYLGVDIEDALALAEGTEV
jgi:hypothetical protein